MSHFDILWEEGMMKSNLIADTTKQERIALIKQWIPDDDGLNDCDMDLWDIYADRIILMESVKFPTLMHR